VQTNEVGRCALLLPAFQVVASMAALPLAIIEVGCSAGLNLRFDDYRYHYKSAAGTVVAGRAGSDVAIDCRLVGEIPPLLETTPSVVSRVGLELNPVDVTDSSDEAWIRALIWPDQPERHRRLAAALRRAATDPPPIVAGDALTDLAPLAAGLPTEAAVCVVHTHVVNQLSPAGRQAFDDVLLTLSQGRPVYRIASEWLRTPAPVLDLTVYEQGTGSNIPLGTADKHGAWLDWFGVE
jgi:hypothetical protein